MQIRWRNRFCEVFLLSRIKKDINWIGSGLECRWAGRLQLGFQIMGQEVFSLLERKAMWIMIWDVAITVPRVLQVYITSSCEDAD